MVSNDSRNLFSFLPTAASGSGRHRSVTDTAFPRLLPRWPICGDVQTCSPLRCNSTAQTEDKQPYGETEVERVRNVPTQGNAADIASKEAKKWPPLNPPPPRRGTSPVRRSRIAGQRSECLDYERSQVPPRSVRNQCLGPGTLFSMQTEYSPAILTLRNNSLLATGSSSR